MRHSCRIRSAVVTLLLALAAGAPARAGVSLDGLNALARDFNEAPRRLRQGSLLLPVNFIAHEGETYAYYVPTRLQRMSESGATFRIRAVKTRHEQVRLEVETPSGARLFLVVCDKVKLRQTFADGVVPLVIQRVFEYGEAPPPAGLVGHADSRLVHLDLCNHLPDPARRVPLATVAEAEAAGYRRCPACFVTLDLLPYDDYLNLRLESLEEARLFQTAFPPVDDAAVQARVRAAGERVLGRLPFERVGFDYEFQVVHSIVPNARAMPTGFVFVTDALLDMIENEDELEFVLAHEIAHCELFLAPAGDVDPPIPAYASNPGEIWAKWRRHRELAADQIAVFCLQTAGADSGSVARARGALAKMQMPFDSAPDKEKDERRTHPRYEERLRAFDPQRFEPAARQAPADFCPEEGALFRITPLAKSRDDKKTYVHLLIEGSADVRRAWLLDPQYTFVRLIDAGGRGWELYPCDFSRGIDADQRVVVKADAGSEKDFAKLDLRSGPVKFAPAPR